MPLTTSSITHPSFVFSVLSFVCRKVTPHYLFFSGYGISVSFASVSCSKRLIKCWSSLRRILFFHFVFSCQPNLLPCSQLSTECQSPKSVSRPDLSQLPNHVPRAILSEWPWDSVPGLGWTESWHSPSLIPFIWVLSTQHHYCFSAPALFFLLIEQ